MEAPPGFSEKFALGEGCRLKRAQYGVKQSLKAWFGRYTIAMWKFGYRQSNSDHKLFFKKRGNLTNCLIIYVDDMIIIVDDKEEMGFLNEILFQEFEMKDLEGVKYFLGIKVLRSKVGIFISQRKYILYLLT